MAPDMYRFALVAQSVERRTENPCAQVRFLALAPDIGGVAQLGEHLLCKQAVIGSIPIASTISAPIRCTNGEFAMKRKPLAPRNPFGAAALLKKAGSHAKPYKAVRRSKNVAHCRVVAQGQNGLLPRRREFDPLRPDHETANRCGLAARICLLFQFPSSSSTVERPAVNRRVAGSSPAWGARFS